MQTRFKAVNLLTHMGQKRGIGLATRVPQEWVTAVEGIGETILLESVSDKEGRGAAAQALHFRVRPRQSWIGPKDHRCTSTFIVGLRFSRPFEDLAQPIADGVEAMKDFNSKTTLSASTPENKIEPFTAVQRKLIMKVLFPSMPSEKPSKPKSEALTLDAAVPKKRKDLSEDEEAPKKKPRASS